MHYLVTGHTGFKGAWLSLLLTKRGHQVSGISLDPVENSLFERARVTEVLTNDVRLDIRNANRLTEEIQRIQPDVVMHLAAQPLVRRSYREPRETFETNVIGTLNVLQALQTVASVKACLVVTTDKVYKNVNRLEGYVESEPLGGRDPYSASKAMADLLTQSWMSSFPGTSTGIARAGNVIGGGDVCEDRLLPDVVHALATNAPIVLRYPEAIRPWQHVLDCLNGYLALVEDLLQNESIGEWNFGPGSESLVSVKEIADFAISYWGSQSLVTVENELQLPEAALLALNSGKAHEQLGWDNALKFPKSLEWTLAWEKSYRLGNDAKAICLAQIEEFERIVEA
jgi:CDP-glucose 4,6-dehydratase